MISLPSFSQTGISSTFSKSCETIEKAERRAEQTAHFFSSLFLELDAFVSILTHLSPHTSTSYTQQKHESWHLGVTVSIQCACVY